jgi:hypothetical protein
MTHVVATVLVDKDFPQPEDAEEVRPIVLALRKAGADLVQFEDAEEWMARGRVADCDCQLISCVCAEARTHEPKCRHRVALTCAVAIVCEHGSDVCPQCDPCTCSTQREVSHA